MPGELTPTSGPPQPEPGFWPRGADQGIVQDCNCEYCQWLSEHLDEYQEGIAPDGKHAALQAFAGGAGD